MKFLIFGHRGWIGKQITDILHGNGENVLHSGRVYSWDSVVDDLRRWSPDYIIVSLGCTSGPHVPTIDYLEYPGMLNKNLMSNLVAPFLISLAADLHGSIPVLYIGSGCIFEFCSDQAVDGFTEQAHPNFFGSSYSVVKGQTDELYRTIVNSICARIRMPLTLANSPKDFITKILSYENVISQQNSMTVLHDVLPLLLACLEAGARGHINAVNPGTVDHREIIALFGRNGLCETNKRFVTDTESRSLLLSRRSNNLLCTESFTHLTSELQPQLLTKYGATSVLHPLLTTIMDIHRYRSSQLHPGLRIEKPRTILVTGGAGFIGSNWIRYWTEKHPQDRIVNIDNLSKKLYEEYTFLSDTERYTFVHGDISDMGLLEQTFQHHSFTHIVHFAAQSNVDHSFSDPVSSTTANVVATHVLLEATMRYGDVQMFVYISTDEVYGEIPVGSFGEQETAFNPSNPYAASKLAAECLVRAYGKMFGLPYVITRSNNIYGPKQSKTNAVPCFIDQVLKNLRIRIHGNGLNTRRFLHVVDKCRALEVILQRGAIGEVYNIGITHDTSVLELSRLVLQCSGTMSDPEEWIEHMPDRIYNDCRYAVDCTKIQQLGWAPTVELKEGLSSVFKWYSANLEHSD